jgi:hypothetical protein
MEHLYVLQHTVHTVKNFLECASLIKKENNDADIHSSVIGFPFCFSDKSAHSKTFTTSIPVWMLESGERFSMMDSKKSVTAD